MRLVSLIPTLCTTVLLLILPTTASAVCDTAGLPDGTGVVELTLSNGTLCLELLADDAPGHVENFLWYIDGGEYDGSLFHRHIAGFVLQGGNKRRAAGGGWEIIPPRPEHVVWNEPCTLDTPAPTPQNPDLEICSERGNERGTVALAKLSGDPDSGSTNWFINLADNRQNLDNQNGGFTVFARIMGAGMDYVDSLVPSGYLTNWVSGSLLATDSAALMAPPSYGGYSGCFDPLGGFSVVLDFPNLYAVKPDPRGGVSSPFFLSTDCGAGTPVSDPGSFVANPCSGTWTSADELAVGVDPVSLSYNPLPPTYVRYSCSEVDELLSEANDFDAALAAMVSPTFQTAYENQVVYIESTRYSVVPEPSQTLLGASAIATLMMLSRRSSPVG